MHEYEYTFKLISECKRAKISWKQKVEQKLQIYKICICICIYIYSHVNMLVATFKVNVVEVAKTKLIIK